MAQLIRPLLAAVVLVGMFTFFFVYPAHDPKPSGLPIGLVDTQGPMVEGLTFERYPDRDAAIAAILDREIYGAVIDAVPEPEVLKASAASLPASQLIDGVAQGDATEVRPLDRDDPRGVAINLTILPLCITAILGAMLMFTIAPAVRGPQRLVGIALFAALGGTATLLIVHVWLGVLPGAFPALTGVAALAIYAIATSASALMRLVGPPGIMLSFLVFLMLGNPASGAATAPELLPEPWSTGGQFLPPGALATGLRNVAYFDGAQLPAWLGVLVAWAALGTAVLLIKRDPAPHPGAG